MIRSILKECSFSSYIFPVRNGLVAILKYGKNGYGPIGGRIDGEDFIMALRRELTEELSASVAKLVDVAVKIPAPYAFRHTNPERTQKRGVWAEEHHFLLPRYQTALSLPSAKTARSQYPSRR